MDEENRELDTGRKDEMASAENGPAVGGGRGTVPEPAAESKPRLYTATRLSLFLRIMVGAYLLYTTYSLTTGLLSGAEGNPVVFILFAVLFGVFGVFLVVSSVRNLLTGRYVGGALDNHTVQEEEEK